MARKQKKYHYIYKTTNNLNGKYYIGMHSTHNLEDGYMGSGKRLWSSMNYHGKDNHSVEILEFCDSREELRKRESEMVTNDLLKEDLCLNLKVGGEGGWHKYANAAFRRKMETDESFRVTFSKRMTETNNKRVQSGEHKNWSHTYSWSGKTFTDEHKSNISKSKSGTYTGNNNSQYGTCWITKCGEDKKVNVLELTGYLTNGWSKGRSNYIKPPSNKKFGASNGNSKLDEESVLEIKKLLLSEDKISTTNIAKRFGVSRPTIYDIKNGKTWSHLTFLN